MVTSYSILSPHPPLLPLNLSPIQFCVGAVVRLGNGKNQHCLRARGLGENVSKTFENRLLLRRVSTIFSLIVACSRGSCGGTSLKRGEFRLHSKRPHVLALVAKAPNIVQLKITLN